MGDFCPIVGKRCVRDRCKFWLVEEMTNTQTGERKLVHDCLVVHQYHLARTGVVEQLRQIATTDKVATTLRTGFSLLANLTMAAEAPGSHPRAIAADPARVLPGD